MIVEEGGLVVGHLETNPPSNSGKPSVLGFTNYHKTSQIDLPRVGKNDTSTLL